MRKYLGTFKLNIEDSPVADWDRTQFAMYFIDSYGQIDGAHHKQWVLDQVARILLGTKCIVEEAQWLNPDGSTSTDLRISTDESSHEYNVWVKDQLGEEFDGEYEYDYDEGIAP